MRSFRERFIQVFNEGDVSDGLPIMEWADWWDQTMERFKREGLPREWGRHEFYTHFGLDQHHQFGLGPSCPPAPSHGAPVIRSEAEYMELRKTLYPKFTYRSDATDHWTERQEKGEAVVWLTLIGPFWYPRTLFGIEPHLLAFYEHPELMKRMNEDLTEFNIRMIEEACRNYHPDFMTFAEDMSYNHGPMISRDLFEEFMAPYYREMVPVLKKHGIVPIVDSDGDIEPVIPWFESVGMEGILPLERMAGVDVCRIREHHPKWKMMGGFDKTVMHLGEEAMRGEFARIKPAVMRGYFIPACDHQTPPGVSLEDYVLYVRPDEGILG